MTEPVFNPPLSMTAQHYAVQAIKNNETFVRELARNRFPDREYEELSKTREFREAVGFQREWDQAVASVGRVHPNKTLVSLLHHPSDNRYFGPEHLLIIITPELRLTLEFYKNFIEQEKRKATPLREFVLDALAHPALTPSYGRFALEHDDAFDHTDHLWVFAPIEVAHNQTTLERVSKRNAAFQLQSVSDLGITRVDLYVNDKGFYWLAHRPGLEPCAMFEIPHTELRK